MVRNTIDSLVRRRRVATSIAGFDDAVLGHRRGQPERHRHVAADGANSSTPISSRNVT